MKCTGVGAAKVFYAIQGHWLSASLGVMLQLKVADILLNYQAGQAARDPSGRDTCIPDVTAIGNGTSAANHGAHANGSTANAQTSGMPLKQVINSS